jgi:pimeloyl-ACP methyl ester carboxylesterase
VSSAVIHRTVADDGTQIAGRVVGHGPPLVLVHGGLSDGETAWLELVPALGRHATCYLLNLRGRGLSADHPDHHFDRLAGDVAAFVDSIGGPVGVFGHSSGARYALGAAAVGAAVGALALYEPALPELDDGVARRWRAAVTRIARAAEGGHLSAGARTFLAEVAMAAPDELEAADDAGEFHLLASYVPATLREAEQVLTYRLLDTLDLTRIAAPVLLLHGSETHPAYAAATHHLVEHLTTVELREIAGAGHLGPQSAAAPSIADELASFLARAPAGVGGPPVGRVS